MAKSNTIDLVPGPKCDVTDLILKVIFELLHCTIRQGHVLKHSLQFTGELTATLIL